ncbi:ATPase family AAA domain-containing protein 3 [Cucurbita argyrosperma subsp. argyrosperma]|nr:ATPase family AAA domain-containing protein 3 [Cucurbita argyrosperma subsp. argyrosperma]
MAVPRLSACVAMAAAAASLPTIANRTYADYPFRFSPFSSSHTSTEDKSSDEKSDAKPAVEEPSKSGFDAEALERGAKALREINSSPNAKKVFELMKNQEQARLAEVAAEKAHYEVIQAQADIDRQRKLAEEQRNLIQQQAQAKAQMLRYEDELARKRMQTDHEAQRRHNVELVGMQEQSSIRKEQARQVTEEQIRAQQRQTEKERAEIERETIRVKAMAEAEGRAHEAKLTEDHNRRMLMERIRGVRILLTDRNKLVLTVGGATALAAGVYTTREGARVMWGYVNRLLGQPSLIRESSVVRFPGFKIIPWELGRHHLSQNIKMIFGNVVLHPSLKRRIEQLSRTTANTKAHEAPFRNMLFHGPPGTGKTMVAKEIARKSGLDYAMMTGGDVPQAVTKIHQIFDWAKNSRKGLLLFIDEADAFLCDSAKCALNALLFRTGDQSRDIVLVLATNRPGDLDSAVTDRMDEVIEFPLPGEEERFKLLKLYLNTYLSNQNEAKSNQAFSFKKIPQQITIRDITDDILRDAARKIKEFSGREIAKLLASVQAAVYGRPDCILDSMLFTDIVDYKVTEHHQRLKLAAEGCHPV